MQDSPGQNEAATDAPGREVRRRLRRAATATLATLQRDDGAPYASLVVPASDACGQPLLLLSDLAEHTRNLKADARASLLIDATAGLAEPLAGLRATLQGRLERSEAPADQARYLAIRPDAARYAGFGDFACYRLAVARVHLVAGFGRIAWLAAAEVLLPPAPALAAREADIIAHMNDDHGDVIQLYAQRLLGQAGTGWELAALDPEGCHLRREHQTVRLDFQRPCPSADQVRLEFIQLARQARQQGQGAQVLDEAAPPAG